MFSICFQAALGEPKKASENVIVSVKINDKKLVLGTLSVEKHPQISCDLFFDKGFRTIQKQLVFSSVATNCLFLYLNILSYDF
jgi:hypothetical protein